MSARVPSAVFAVALDEVQPFGSPPSLEEMARDFAKIGSTAAWAQACGEALQHGEEKWKAVAELITLGTLHADPNDEALQGMQVLCPTATAATWWIFSNSELAGDVRLYHELFIMLEASPCDQTQLQRESFSRCVLRAVADKLGMESCHAMNAHFAELDAIDAVGQPNATTSTSTKGSGKGSGKGKH